MRTKRARLLHESLRRSVSRGAWDQLERLIEKTRDEELTLVMESMTPDLQRGIFEHLPSAVRKASVIVLMEPPFGVRMLGALPAAAAAAILTEMASDDMADILADLPEESQAAILEIIDSAEVVESLMQYGEDTAGGIMVPHFVALRADNTAEEALVKLRESPDVEMVYYVYVVDDVGQLLGVLSMRRLVTAGPSTQIRDIMETDVIRVSTDTDQEDVAELVSRYGFLAIPVVDASNVLLGVVTVDDIIDVIREEAAEDMLKMAGAGPELVEQQGVATNVRHRFPWLLATCAGGLVAAAGMGLYEDMLRHEGVFFAFFLPLVLGMSGNVGTQAATVTVRALAVGHIAHASKGWAVIRKEFAIGCLLGLGYGVVIGLVAAAFGAVWAKALAIGLSVSAGMIAANVIGAGIPLVMNRLNIDPAVATGPVLTTSVDILGIFTYFGIIGAFSSFW